MPWQSCAASRRWRRRRTSRRGSRKSRRGEVMKMHAILLASAFWLLASLLLSSTALAQPTQEEVFKSIGDNVNESADSARALGVIAAVAGLVILLVVVGQRHKRSPGPRAVNHQGKLLKEGRKNVPLKAPEGKKIKALALDLRPHGRDEKLQSPLTPLLCPTLLGEAARQSRGKADLPVVAGLVKRLVSR